MTVIVAHKTSPNGLRITQHFWTHEFACNCPRLHKEPAEGFCQGAVNIGHPRFFEFVMALERLRDKVSPEGGIGIERGFSCWPYHEHIYDEIGKPPTLRSAHLFGIGADIWPRDAKIEKNTENRELLKKLGFSGVGWNMGKRQNKIHLDMMRRENVFTEWDYAA